MRVKLFRVINGNYNFSAYFIPTFLSQGQMELAQSEAADLKECLEMALQEKAEFENKVKTFFKAHDNIKYNNPCHVF